jgi:3'-5' exoribonuclease
MSQATQGHLSIDQLKSPERNKGDAFCSLLLVRKVNSRTAKNNNPFLQVEFGDKTGSFSFVCFNDHPLFDRLQNGAEGRIARVDGQIDHYQNRLSPRIITLDFLSEEELLEPGLLENLVESSPEDLTELLKEFYALIACIEHPQIRATVKAVFNEVGPAFAESAAAIAMHHAYRGGLLEHTVHLARACQALLPLYPQVDPDLALSGCLLHDVGKVLEYTGHLSIKKTRLGILQGHVVLGYRLVRKAGITMKLDHDLLERLEHIVLSHQGELEWGAAAMAATPEAVFVSMIDNLDAKMGMVQSALRQTHETAEFSDYMPGLKAPILTTAVTPRPSSSPPAVEEESPALAPETAAVESEKIP